MESNSSYKGGIFSKIITRPERKIPYSCILNEFPGKKILKLICLNMKLFCQLEFGNLLSALTQLVAVPNKGHVIFTP